MGKSKKKNPLYREYGIHKQKLDRQNEKLEAKSPKDYKKILEEIDDEEEDLDWSYLDEDDPSDKDN